MGLRLEESAPAPNDDKYSAESLQVVQEGYNAYFACKDTFFKWQHSCNPTQMSQNEVVHMTVKNPYELEHREEIEEKNETIMYLKIQLFLKNAGVWALVKEIPNADRNALVNLIREYIALYKSYVKYQTYTWYFKKQIRSSEWIYENLDSRDGHEEYAQFKLATERLDGALSRMEQRVKSLEKQIVQHELAPFKHLKPERDEQDKAQDERDKKRAEQGKERNERAKKRDAEVHNMKKVLDRLLAVRR